MPCKQELLCFCYLVIRPFCLQEMQVHIWPVSLMDPLSHKIAAHWSCEKQRPQLTVAWACSGEVRLFTQQERTAILVKTEAYLFHQTRMTRKHWVMKLDVLPLSSTQASALSMDGIFQPTKKCSEMAGCFLSSSPKHKTSSSGNQCRSPSSASLSE